MKNSFEERFWSKVKRMKSNECWEWIGYLKPDGYGLTRNINMKKHNAHRVAWEIIHGEIPKGEGYHGYCVLHKCDNRSCVNPSHLFLGTHKDNMRDMVSKGRLNRKGENNGRAKLTLNDVNKIRRLYKGKRGEQTALGKQFGVAQNTIRDIVFNIHWLDK